MTYLHPDEFDADMIVTDDPYGIRVGVEFQSITLSIEQAKALHVALSRWLANRSSASSP